jgi:hypothetical protein
MSDDLEAMVAQAEARGQRSLRTEPRARSARFDRRTGRVHVELTNGCTFAFPARSAQGLERADDAGLAQVEVLGLGLHWERLDVDLSVSGLLAGLFGTKGLYGPSAGSARGLSNVAHESGGGPAQRRKGRPAAQTAATRKT